MAKFKFINAAPGCFLSLVSLCALNAQQLEYYTLLSPPDSLKIVRKPAVPDLSKRMDDLVFEDFDSKTRWPESLPKSFDPGKTMELGMNRGLQS